MLFKSCFTVLTTCLPCSCLYQSGQLWNFIQDTNSNADADKISNTSQPEVDEEGFSIPKANAVKEDDSWDSSSDSGSDNEEKTRRSKLKV